MTRIKVKTDLFRREVTLENAVSGSTKWRMTCVGFNPLMFDADTAGEAVEEAFRRFTSMSRDDSYAKRKRIVKEDEPVATVPATPIAPLDGSKYAKKADKSLSQATV